MIHNPLEIPLAPSVPASLRNIPTPDARFPQAEHLQDFIYYAYIFYTGLLEEQTISWMQGQIGSVVPQHPILCRNNTEGVGGSVIVSAFEGVYDELNPFVNR
jgi:hypothetical protein